MNFFEKLLPSTGFFCVAELKEEGGFKHRWFEDIAEAVQNIKALDAQGRTIYLAQAAFASQDNRKQENVKSIKAFWLDIDCGKGKPYADQGTGCSAVKTLVRGSGLPYPAIVRSGNGLYAYWFLQEELPEATWKGVAKLLKETLTAYGFEADPARTADSSSVLRPPGTTNRKDPLNPKPVNIIKDSEPIPFETFRTALEAAAKAKKVDTKVLKPPRPVSLNAEFAVQREEIPSSAHIIAEECAQIRKIRDTKGNVDEPLWYAGIGLLRFTTEAPGIIHTWSQGHPDYSETATTQKISQHQTPPTTCHHFGAINPTSCVGCKYNGKVNTPLVLGRPKPKAADPDKFCPAGYTRATNGLWFKGDEREVHVYDWDIWPVNLQRDESVGYETVTIRHTHPFNGEKEFTVQSSLIGDHVQYLKACHNEHVQIVGKDAKAAFVGYMENYMQRLRQTSLSVQYCQMGWKDGDNNGAGGNDNNFVLGSSIFTPGGAPKVVGLARNVPELVKAFRKEGDTGEWIRATECLNSPEMAPYAFILLAGGFGAPLLKFTGYKSAFLSAIGDSGIGKTVMLRWIHSVWGDPEKLMCLRDDTRNSLVSRLGVYGSLPLTIDELSNIDPMELSDLVYRVTQGRDKARLTKECREGAMVNAWNTLAVATSNHSLVEKLGQAKSDASAEINRMFEINLEKTEVFERVNATAIYRALGENYGGIGEIYVQYLVDHAAEHREKLDRITAQIDALTGAKSEERFWSAIAACAIYGGLIAQSLGLIKFEITPIFKWVTAYIPTMRSVKYENTVAPTNIIASFLDTYNTGILVVRKDKCADGKSSTLHFRELRNALVGRFELDTMRLFISKDALKHYCQRSYVSMRQTATALQNTQPKSALVNTSRSKTLGAGVDYLPSIKQNCWELDMSCPELGYITAALVKRDSEVQPERKVAEA